MAIATDSYFDVTYNSNVVDRIGLSKNLNQYTVDELKTMTFCGMQNKLIKNVSERTNESLVKYTAMSQPTPFNAEQTEVIKNGGKYELSSGTGTYNYPDGLPVSIMWLAFSAGTKPHRILRNTDTQLDACKIITEIDAPKYEYEVVNPVQVLGVGATSWNDEHASLYYNELYFNGTDNQLKYRIDNETLVQVNPMDGPVAPYFFTELNGDFILLQLNTDTTQWYNRGNGTSSPWDKAGYTGGGSLIPYVYSVETKSYGTTLNVVSMSDTYGGANILPYEWYYSEDYAGADWGAEMIKWGVSDDGHPMIIHFGESPYDGSGFHRGFCTHNYFNTRDEIYNFIAGGGIKFKTDKVYKPIIQGGWVTGYTDDMAVPSELDNWHGSTVHAVTPTPPAPTPPPHPSGDIETDMPLAYIGGTAGMVDFIKINASGLASADDIADALSRFDITTIGKDLLRNFVSFKCFAVLDIDDSVVRDIKVAGHTLKDEKDNALQGEYIGGVAPVDFSAGRVEPVYNDYRDYAPYTRIQMYVPFCGWFDLPSWCMGKEITGTMFTDIYNGTVKAVIYASRTVVAEVGGCCAFDIPFAAESTGMKAGAVISSALSTIAMTGATIAAPNIATGIAAVSSAANFISAANSNGTTLKGVMGDGSNTNGLLHVYIKTTRPNSPDGAKAIPERYKHENGIPCFKQLTLTAGDGYTQIMDANISGAMTDREKQMIIDGFRHGLIL